MTSTSTPKPPRYWGAPERSRSDIWILLVLGSALYCLVGMVIPAQLIELLGNSRNPIAWGIAGTLITVGPVMLVASLIQRCIPDWCGGLLRFLSAFLGPLGLAYLGIWIPLIPWWVL